MRSSIMLALVATLCLSGCLSCQKHEKNDSDGDGVTDGDNCPYLRNSHQDDQDGDGFGDLCDECPFDGTCVYRGICGECQPQAENAPDAGHVAVQDAGIAEHLEPILLLRGRSTGRTVLRGEFVETLAFLGVNNNGFPAALDQFPLKVSGVYATSDFLGVRVRNNAGADCGYWAGFQQDQPIGGTMVLNTATCLMPPHETSMFFVDVFVAANAGVGDSFHVTVTNPEQARAHSLTELRRELHVLYDDIVSADFTISGDTSSTLGVDPEIIFYRDPQQPWSREVARDSQDPAEMLVVRANNRSGSTGLQQDALIYSFAVKGEGSFLPNDVASLVVYDNRLGGQAGQAAPIYEYDMPLSDEITTISFLVPRLGQDASYIKVPWANSNEMAFTVAVRLSRTARVGSTIKLRALPESFLVRGPEGRRFEKVFLDELVGNSITIGQDSAIQPFVKTMQSPECVPHTVPFGQMFDDVLQIHISNTYSQEMLLHGVPLLVSSNPVDLVSGLVVTYENGASFATWGTALSGSLNWVTNNANPIHISADGTISLNVRVWLRQPYQPGNFVTIGLPASEGLNVRGANDFIPNQIVGDIVNTATIANQLSQCPPVDTCRGGGNPPCVGMVFKSDIYTAVYYLASNGKRYVFPDDKTYQSWFNDENYACVITYPDEFVQPIIIAGNVTFKPGSAMLKIQSDPAVYAVARYGILRHVTTETLAVGLYGTNWNQFVYDVPDTFFTNYTWHAPGSDITSLDQYSPVNELSNSTIDCATAGGPGC